MKSQQVFDVVVEIPKHSNVKYEYDRKKNQLRVDRILYGSQIYPQNYGFIEQTLDWDGDELDALVIADHGFQVGAIVPARILGAMEMIDGGETDTKLIAVLDCDPRFKHIQTLNDVPGHLLAEIKDFFTTYKNLQNKKVSVGKFHDLSFALKEIFECQTLFQKFFHLKKTEFLAQMRTQHPEKYSKE